MFYDDDYDGSIEDFRITEPINQPPLWFGNEVLYEDAYGELHSMTMEEWHETLLLGDDFIVDYFGDDTLGIIRDLEAAGYWTEEDWEEWRDAYASVHGV